MNDFLKFDFFTWNAVDSFLDYTNGQLVACVYLVGSGYLLVLSSTSSGFCKRGAQRRCCVMLSTKLCRVRRLFFLFFHSFIRFSFLCCSVHLYV